MSGDTMSDPLWTNDEISQELDSHTEKLLPYNDALAAVNKVRDDYEANRTTLTDNLTDAEENILNLNSQLETAEDQNSALTSQNQALTDQNSTLTSQNQTLTNQNAALTDQNKTLTDQNTALQLQVKDLAPDVVIKIGSLPKGVSNFSIGVTDADNKDLLYANPTARDTAIRNLQG